MSYAMRVQLSISWGRFELDSRYQFVEHGKISSSYYSKSVSM
jgi:hypothetical protein